LQEPAQAVALLNLAEAHRELGQLALAQSGAMQALDLLRTKARNIMKSAFLKTWGSSH